MSWRYVRAVIGQDVELAICPVGCSEALVPHFHEEAQISFVLTGWRQFLVNGCYIDVPARSSCVLPAGVPHQAIDCAPNTVCLNLYVPAEHSLALMSMTRPLGELFPDMPSFAEDATIACVAVRSGLTREGFTRRFSRCHGMPPHAYRRMLRLNCARQMLRTGTPPAEVAAATNFADQSHLGRWFRRAFGTTPSRYQLG
ncbi:AraC family transcriptional regulator [Methylobacterium sp. E-045]|uniref:AraC family transcriptional regulator n=1 Tax=Methylobacterium sp. E-045 TaxID=2836575 RepID=UPI001FBA14B1|nr:helix-turn-helix transcriptional regulator [Methylobacterium sp. E-045]MCJ2128186.1 helix-turn-helix transcriptional regulator [Methylobacterium sp. E-045]